MKLILIGTIGFLLSNHSCNSAKTKTTTITNDKAITSNTMPGPVVKGIDSLPSKKNNVDTIKEKPVVKENAKPKAETSAAKIPGCIKALIESFKKEEKQNPPRSVYSYMYKGKTVFYVAAVCCDNFSDLYNGDCKLIAHPDGGFTGRGDGKLPDFTTTRTGEKLLWHDVRK